MSLLPVQAYANANTPLWASADISGGGPTGPTGPAGATGATGPAGAGGSFVTQIFQYEVPSGSNGGTAPGTGTFYARPFNTGYPALDITGNSSVIAGLSLDVGTTSTIFTFPAGTFAISGELGGLMTVEKARLYDSASSNVLALGTSVGDDNRTNYSSFYTIQTFASPTTVEAQFAGFSSVGTQDWGQGTGFGDNEVFSRLVVTRL